MAESIVWFKDLKKESIGVAGGKGANLGEMTAAGLPVPPGFVVSAQAYDAFLSEADLRPDIQEFLTDLDVEDNEKLQLAAKSIKQLITAAAMPDALQKVLTDAYHELSKGAIVIAGVDTGSLDGDFVAVRSSATAEDLPDASFAGQQATFLNVRGYADLINAVKKCWASLFEARAIYYRVRKGFAHDKVLISVIVQKMVDSEKSGVMFTVEPSTNDRSKLTIEGAFGLGEAIVGGEVTPDQYTVDKNSLDITDTRINKKTFMYTRDPTTGKTEKIELNEEQGMKQVLTPEEVQKLAAFGKEIEAHYGAPQDIEWAIEDNEIFIVQSRAITTLNETAKQVAAIPSADDAPKGEVIIKGFGASPGLGAGGVKIIRDVSELGKIQTGDILVAKMTTPDMVPAMEKATAIVTDEGGITCHAAIVSRELGIPCIVGTRNATSTLQEQEQVTVDGTQGEVRKGIEKIEVKEEITDYSKVPSTKTKIYVNLGVPSKAAEVSKLPVDGVGLMREEFIFASKINEHPLALMERGESQKLVDTLAEGIAEVARAFSPRPVVLRLSDFKTNEYRALKGGEKFEQEESNPMIGWRGCSRYTSPKYEQAFRLELKAVKKVRDEMGLKNLNLMLPFVRILKDVTRVTEIMRSEGLERGPDLKLLIMAEVPSNIFLADEFAKLVDGFSIGSNDLTQLVLGTDRDSEYLAELGYFDERNEAVKRAISHLIKVAHEHNCTIGICGQAPSNYPEFAQFLIQEGIDSISINPDVAVQTKKIVADEEARLSA